MAQTGEEALHLGIVQAAPPSIHADLHAIPSQFSNKFRAGKLAALIRIENLRLPEAFDSHFQRIDAMKRVHRVDHSKVSF